MILPPDPTIDKRAGRERNRRENPRSAERRGYGIPQPMDLYRIEVGRLDGVEVRHIVGAVANEGDIDSRYIGHIKLYDNYSTIELPQGMPKELVAHFTKTRVMNKPMQMSLLGEAKNEGRGGEKRFAGKTKGRNNDSRTGDRKFREKKHRTFDDSGFKPHSKRKKY